MLTWMCFLSCAYMGLAFLSLACGYSLIHWHDIMAFTTRLLRRTCSSCEGTSYMQADPAGQTPADILNSFHEKQQGERVKGLFGICKIYAKFILRFYGRSQHIRSLFPMLQNLPSMVIVVLTYPPGPTKKLQLPLSFKQCKTEKLVYVPEMRHVKQMRRGECAKVQTQSW